MMLNNYILNFWVKIKLTASSPNQMESDGYAKLPGIKFQIDLNPALTNELIDYKFNNRYIFIIK